MSDISIIVCTYNRSEILKQTLNALQKQVFRDRFEILVIDNNSTDQTKEMVAEFSSQSRWLVHYIFESKQGLSYARNRGIQESKSELLAFIDDDTVPDPNWVQSIRNGFDRYQADCVGGPVFPIWPSEAPLRAIFNDGISGPFGLLDRGKKVIKTRQYISNFLLGGNIAFRRSVFDEVGLFRTDLGRTATNLSGGEDSNMIQRALKAEKLAVYLPKALVRHQISPERMEPPYWRKWHFDMGRSTAKISKFHGSIFFNLIADFFLSGLFALFYSVARIKEKAIIAEGNFWWKLGMFVELLTGAGAKNANR